MIRLSMPTVNCEYVERVHVRLTGGGYQNAPKLFLNSSPVPWNEFPALLRAELSRRPPGCPVEVDGSGDMEWRTAAAVIDTARSLGAELVLLPVRNGH